MARVVYLRRGTWVEGLDEGMRREVESLCLMLDNRVADATLALDLYEEAKPEALASVKYIGAGAPPYTGARPLEYVRRLPYLHARTFVTTLAQIERALARLASLDPGRPILAEIAAGFGEALPAVRVVRDSAEHAEDRMRGRDEDNKPLPSVPIDNGMVYAPNGALMGEILNGDSFGWTIHDGTYAEVAITDETLEIAGRAVQDTYDVLPWRKPGTFEFPSR